MLDGLADAASVGSRVGSIEGCSLKLGIPLGPCDEDGLAVLVGCRLTVGIKDGSTDVDGAIEGSADATSVGSRVCSMEGC